LAIGTIMMANDDNGWWPDLHNTRWTWNPVSDQYAAAANAWSGYDAGNLAVTGYKHPDNSQYSPNNISINARDKLLGRKAGTTGLNSSTMERTFRIFYCPSNPTANGARNSVNAPSWQQQGGYIFHGPGMGNVAGIGMNCGYSYFPSTYVWGYGGFYLPKSGNSSIIMNNTWDAKDSYVKNKPWPKPIFSRFTVPNPVFSMKMSDHPQYKVIWCDRVGASGLANYGKGDLASLSTHMKGTEIAVGHVPASAFGGANVAYGDGHVEWKTAGDYAHGSQLMFRLTSGGGTEMHEYVPPN
jgi:prepilin-type processing-associated H-X9-DG protein